MKKPVTSLKTLISFVFLFVFAIMPFKNQAQVWQWALSGGGGGTDGGRKACVDPTGNPVIGGYFGSTSINLSGTTITNAGASGTDVYIVKYDAAGNYIWSQRIGGTGSEFLGGICSDANGNVYVAVYFDSPSITISPYGVTNSGSNDILIAKFNSNGSILSMTKFGGTGNESVTGIAFSNAQSAIYIAGNYSAPTLAFGTTTLTNTNNSGSSFDMYVAKLTSGGTTTWAKTAGSSNSNEFVGDIECDGSSFPYVFGSFNPVTSNSTTIGTTQLISNGGSDVYLAKYSDVGTFQWAKNIGCSGSDNALGIEIDGSNNPYIVGNYFGSTMNLGTLTLTNTGAYDAFIAKCNSAGTFQWATKIGGPNSDVSNDITVDANNNIYVTGAFTGTVVPVGTYSMVNSNPGSTDETYVVKYNSSGVAQWAATAKGSGYETGYGITSDQLGNLFVTGAYNISSPAAFGTTTLNSAGGNDMFVAKIGCASTSINGLPNVCTGSSATLTASGATTYSWSTGAITSSIVITPTASASYSLTGTSGSCNATASTFSVNLLPAALNPGSNLNLMCGQKQVMTATTSPAATSVTWAPSTNLSSTSVLNPTVTALGSAIQYTVKTTLNNGCVLSKTVGVNSFAPLPDICMVTVDSLGLNNEIYWNKNLYPMLDSMIIYRETSTSVYKRIGAVSKTALSMFTDTVRSVGPSNGDPTVSTYRYKIRMRDTCGIYSNYSLWHNTIYFTNNLGTFFWVNNYTIEGSPLPTNPVLNYSLMVCINPSISPSYSVVGITAGNQNSLTDPNYLVYQATADWRVYGNLGYNCSPTVKNNGVLVQATKSRSNIQNNRIIGLSENINLSSVKIYPNPASDQINVDFENLSNTSVCIELENILGQTIFQTTTTNGHNVIKTIGLAPGVYSLSIKHSGKIISVKKIIVNK